MKFWCGESQHAKRDRTEEWHPWFAWYPVLVENATKKCWYWLSWIERRVHQPASMWDRRYVIYRTNDVWIRWFWIYRKGLVMYNSNYPLEPEDTIILKLSQDNPRFHGVLIRKFEVKAGRVLRDRCLVCNKYVDRNHCHKFKIKSILNWGIG